MKKSPKVSIEEGVFIAFAYETVLSNLPAIVKIEADSSSFKEFLFKYKKEIAIAILETYQTKGDISDEKILAVMGLIVGNVSRLVDDIWINSYGLKILLESME